MSIAVGLMRERERERERARRVSGITFIRYAQNRKIGKLK
jgi:hypothetical protein